MKKKKILAVINARSGSKGIPHKNIKKIAGKRLIEWSINVAISEKSIDRVIVSTDSQFIRRISIKLGADAPFLRDKKIALDNTPGILPVLDVLRRVRGYEYVVLLQPTSPLRTKKDLKNFIRFALENKIKSAVSVCRVTDHPELIYQVDSNGNLKKFLNSKKTNRQSFQKLFKVNGSMYFAEINWLLKNKNFFYEKTKFFEMTKSNSLDIDDNFDWEVSEYFLNKMYNNK